MSQQLNGLKEYYKLKKGTYLSDIFSSLFLRPSFGQKNKKQL